MKNLQKAILPILITLFFATALIAQPARKFDTTMKIGKAGYKVFCNNKSADLNSITINPTGFEKEAREISVNVKGRIMRAEIDDLNNDGFPDMVMYVLSPGDKVRVTVFGISSEENKGIGPIYFPDIYDDPKLRIGYNGGDQFNLMEGMLMRRFPVYKHVGDSATSEPTNMMRQIQYRVGKGDRGEMKFKIVRSYDFAKQ